MVENLQREDLNAIDKASAFREYLSRYGGTQEELAGRLGLDRSTVSNLIRLLELPERGPRRGPLQRRSPRARPGAARPPRRREPDRRLPADRRRAPLGAADRGPGQPRACRRRSRTQGPQRPGSRSGRQGPPSSRSRTAAPSTPGNDRPDPAPESGSRPDHHRLPVARGIRPPRVTASGRRRLVRGFLRLALSTQARERDQSGQARCAQLLREARFVRRASRSF